MRLLVNIFGVCAIVLGMLAIEELSRTYDSRLAALGVSSIMFIVMLLAFLMRDQFYYSGENQDRLFKKFYAGYYSFLFYVFGGILVLFAVYSVIQHLILL